MTFSKTLKLFLITTLTLVTVSCATKNQYIDLEMPYATSNEQTIVAHIEKLFAKFHVDTEYTYENNIIEFSVKESNIEDIKNKIESQEKNLTQYYISNGYADSIEINDMYTEIKIDCPSTLSSVKITELCNNYSEISLLHQAVDRIPADDYSFKLTLSIDHEVYDEIILNKELLVQS